MHAFCSHYGRPLSPRLLGGGESRPTAVPTRRSVGYSACLKVHTGNIGHRPVQLRVFFWSNPKLGGGFASGQVEILSDGFPLSPCCCCVSLSRSISGVWFEPSRRFRSLSHVSASLLAVSRQRPRVTSWPPSLRKPRTRSGGTVPCSRRDLLPGSAGRRLAILLFRREWPSFMPLMWAIDGEYLTAGL